MKYPEYIQKLIESFSKFPSVGPKTAERYVFYLLNQKTVQVKELASFISSLPDNIKRCSICRTFSDSDPCPICGDKKRSPEILCIVENSQDLAVIENTKQFNGRYFVIDRLLNTLENIGPDQLPLKELKELVNANKVKELILGLNFT